MWARWGQAYDNILGEVKVCTAAKCHGEYRDLEFRVLSCDIVLDGSFGCLPAGSLAIRQEEDHGGKAGGSTSLLCTSRASWRPASKERLCWFLRIHPDPTHA